MSRQMPVLVAATFFVALVHVPIPPSPQLAPERANLHSIPSTAHATPRWFVAHHSCVARVPSVHLRQISTA